MSTSTIATDTRHADVRPGDNDDPFHDPVVIGIGLTLVGVSLVILALTALFYWGNLYDSPSWSSRAFPPAVAH